MKQGRAFKPGVFYPPNLNVWPHEKKTAETLAEHGFYVEFREKSERFRERSADSFINGELWEFKAPNGRKMLIVEQNLRRGKKQSGKIVFDTHRIKELPDHAVLREIRAKMNYLRGVDHVKVINKRREIVDIVKGS